MVEVYRAASRATLGPRNGGVPWHESMAATSRRSAFERTSKRRRGFPSETNVGRGDRIVHGDKELLLERLGRNDPCPCGSGRRYKRCCLKAGTFRRLAPRLLLSATDDRQSPAFVPSEAGLLMPGARVRDPHDRVMVWPRYHLDFTYLR